jgi:hypothetical protein
MLSTVKSTTTVFVLLCSFSMLLSCRKASTETLNEMVTDGGEAMFTGNFSGVGNQSVSGTAKIFFIGNKYELKLENFRTDNGPDLKVYLSKADKPSEFISLGDIKSTNGNQVYNIEGMPDFKVHSYVLIHCERFNHLYGRAELK